MDIYKNFLIKNIQKHKVLINTIPHCGTHLVSSILDTIGYTHATYRKFGLFKRKVGLNWRLSQKFLNFSPEKNKSSIFVSVASPKLVRFEIVKNSLKEIDFGEYALSHIPFDKKFSNYLSKHNIKVFFIIRDPRDMCISMLKHIQSRPRHFGYNYLFKTLKSNSDRIDFIIKGFVNEKKREFVGINKMYSSMLNWQDNKYSCFLKYEDLVGKQGGGQIKKQIHSIKKIFDKLSINRGNLDTNFFEFVGRESYGKSGTFRKGKIANWKNVLKNKDIITFKKNINDLLIKLKYESNSDWV